MLVMQHCNTIIVICTLLPCIKPCIDVKQCIIVILSTLMRCHTHCDPPGLPLWPPVSPTGHLLSDQWLPVPERCADHGALFGLHVLLLT